MKGYLYVVEIYKNKEYVPYSVRKTQDAADCILTRTDDGFVCKEMATGKIYRVKVK